jgi:hypothetical protein
VPSREQVPDYLEVIEHPMAWDVIHNKIEQAAYPTLTSFAVSSGVLHARTHLTAL